MERSFQGHRGSREQRRNLKGVLPIAETPLRLILRRPREGKELSPAHTICQGQQPGLESSFPSPLSGALFLGSPIVPCSPSTKYNVWKTVDYNRYL